MLRPISFVMGAFPGVQLCTTLSISGDQYCTGQPMNLLGPSLWVGWEHSTADKWGGAHAVVCMLLSDPPQRVGTLVRYPRESRKGRATWCLQRS